MINPTIEKALMDGMYINNLVYMGKNNISIFKREENKEISDLILKNLKTFWERLQKFEEEYKDSKFFNNHVNELLEYAAMHLPKETYKSIYE